MKQVEAVINVVQSFCSENGIQFELGSTKPDFSKAQIEGMTQMLVSAYKAGDISINSEKSAKTPAAYLKSMLNNHLRKDKRLNGGVNYADIKKDGKKRVTDPELKELKKLLSAVTLAGDEAIIAEVTSEVNRRQAELDAEKNKPEAIDADRIPEHLRHLIQG